MRISGRTVAGGALAFTLVLLVAVDCEGVKDLKEETEGEGVSDGILSSFVGQLTTFLGNLPYFNDLEKATRTELNHAPNLDDAGHRLLVGRDKRDIGRKTDPSAPDSVISVSAKGGNEGKEGGEDEEGEGEGGGDEDKEGEEEKKEKEEACSSDDDCRKGEVCVKNADGNFCRCKEGTEGDDCKKVVGCDQLPCQPDAECVYGGVNEAPKCECKIVGLQFDYENGTCRETCKDDEECQNDAGCVENRGGKFCRCKEGTDGHRCEKVVGCDQLLCQPDAECVYGGLNEAPKCECKTGGLQFDYENGTCRETCKDDEECQNYAGCVENRGGKFCRCKEGTDGHRCENIVGCDQLPCQPDAECVYGGLNEAPKCECKTGGLQFDYENGTCRGTCSSDGECRNGARCVEDRGGRFCRCSEGTRGHYCEEVRGCDELACEPDATCKYDEDAKNGSCACRNGTLQFDYANGTCREPCSYSRQCVNGGRCERDRGGRFCRCPAGLGGSFCEAVAGCEDLDCGQGARCTYDVQTGAANCTCEDPHLVYDHQGRECKADPCADGPCHNGGTCRPKGEDTFECLCPERFAGPDCHEKVCLASERAECGNHTRCAYDDLAKRPFCVCGAGKEFDADSKECRAMDACLMKLFAGECSRPHETCRNGDCECETNYRRSGDDCVEDFCKKSNACPSNSDCSDLGSGNVLCVCKQGYVHKGGMCKKINLCTPGLSKCDQLCDPRTGNCSCEPGFTLDGDGRTCKTGDSGGPDCDLECGVGTCYRKKCICPSVTHVFNRSTCVDRCTKNGLKAPSDMCSSGSSAPAGCELSDEHVFRCRCEDPFEQDEDGIHCRRKEMCRDEKVLAECAKKSAVCRETLAGRGYKCDCVRGFVMENGTCVRQCDAKAKHEECASQRATCELDLNYDAVCRCPPLLKRAKVGGVCDTLEEYSFSGTLRIPKSIYVQNVDEASRRYRRSTAEDEVDLMKLQGDIAEAVKLTYKGTAYESSASAKLLRCRSEGSEVWCSLELRLEGGSEADANLLLAPSVCVALDEEHCVVKPRLFLRREEGAAGVFNKTSACDDPAVKERLCGNSTDCAKEGPDGFQCKCRQGFEAIGTYHPVGGRSNTFIQKCNDIDECVRPSNCPNSTDCVNTYGGYECFCKDGYKKKDASSTPKEHGCQALCDPNPCLNGTCFVVGHHGFSCNCTRGYTGILCNTTVDVTPATVDKKSSKAAAVVGGVLGAILFVVVIAGLIVYKKMQQRKDDDDEEYARNRQKSIASQMNRLRKEQPRFETDPDEPGYKRDERVIPRIQTSRDDPGRSRDRTSRDEARSGSNVYYKNRGYDEEEE